MPPRSWDCPQMRWKIGSKSRVRSFGAVSTTPAPRFIVSPSPASPRAFRSGRRARRARALIPRHRPPGVGCPPPRRAPHFDCDATGRTMLRRSGYVGGIVPFVANSWQDMVAGRISTPSVVGRTIFRSGRSPVARCRVGRRELLHRAMAALAASSRREISLSGWSSFAIMREREIVCEIACDEGLARQGFGIAA